MKKTIKILTILALLGATLPVWAQEYKTREIPNAPAFNAIEISGGDVEVSFAQGEKHSIYISGVAKSVKATKVSIKDNTLFISYKEPFFGEDNLTISISAPQLKRVSVYGEVDFKAETGFTGKELTIKTHQDSEVTMNNIAVDKINIEAKGTSSVDLDYIEADTVRANAYDRAEIDLSGRANQAELNKKGMFAEIDSEKLMAKRVNAINPNGKVANNNAVKQVNKNGAIEFEFND